MKGVVITGGCLMGGGFVLVMVGMILSLTHEYEKQGGYYKKVSSSKPQNNSVLNYLDIGLGSIGVSLRF